MMQMKSYQASTVAEALVEIKRDLGSAAVIMNTRRFRKGGVWGLVGGRMVWEVRATSDVDVSPRAGRGCYVADNVSHSEESPAAGDGLAEGMREIRQMVSTLLAGSETQSAPTVSGQLAPLHQMLVDQDVAGDTASQLIGDLQASLVGQETPPAAVLHGRLIDLVAKRIATHQSTDDGGGDDKDSRGCKVIALIGPTGVGKTTTIAKLAANYKLTDGKKVGLVTMDTYRIAAVEQLRTYAKIIDLPIATVDTPGRLHQALRSMSYCDVILLDTAGRSQNNDMRLNELRRFLDVANCDDVHVVVSAAGSRRVAEAAIRRFSELGANGVIMTKLDEAATFGIILSVAQAGPTPIAYVTAGQDVPDDIAPASASALAESIVRGKLHAC